LPFCRLHRCWLSLLLPVLLSCASTSTEQETINLEQSICGLKEAIVFWLWSSAAGGPDASRISGITNLGDLSFTTKDNRVLRGYQLKAHSPGESAATAKGYLLVAQGNAMLAGQIINDFQGFARAGYDVYIFDYRGYGRSEGKRRLKAILSDYDEIIDHLDSLPYGNRLFYGMSFGGIVLLDALQNRSDTARLVIDSTPSRLSDYGCPDAHDPAKNLPPKCEHMLLIVGAKDTVVKPAMSKELVDVANMRGATLIRDQDLAHPFMDTEIGLHYRRLRAVRSYLLA